MSNKNMNLVCVDCGGNATEGSMKHPYCKNCFKLKFKSHKEYFEYLRLNHI